MIRRILGLAHVEDLESIADPERRASCEAKALRLARELVVGAGGFSGLADVTGAARAMERA
jgi:5-methylthioribose kinase